MFWTNDFAVCSYGEPIDGDTIDLSVFVCMIATEPECLLCLSFFTTLGGIVLIFLEVATCLIASYWRFLLSLDYKSSLSCLRAMDWCDFFYEFAALDLASFYCYFLADIVIFLVLGEPFSFFVEVCAVPAYPRFIFFCWVFSCYILNFFKLFCIISNPGRFFFWGYELVSTPTLTFDWTVLMALVRKPVELSFLSRIRFLYSDYTIALLSFSSTSVVKWIFATTAAALKLWRGPCIVLLLRSFVWGLLHGVVSVFVYSSPDSMADFSEM